jgi:5-methylcytosine-specific restriction protein A
MGEVYGPIGEGLIHAHHLTPLSSLADGETVELDPRTAFAVLFPNCHAIIHRMDDVSDIEGLKAMIGLREGPDIPETRLQDRLPGRRPRRG